MSGSATDITSDTTLAELFLADPDRLLWTSDVAKVFHVTRRTAHRWARAGKLPVSKMVGKHRRFRVCELITVGRPQPHRNPEPICMRTGQVAALFEVSGMTIIRWSNDGRLPAQRTPGGHRRFLKSEIQDPLQEWRAFKARRL
jgi:excisionase family DNA binding protein